MVSPASHGASVEWRGWRGINGKFASEAPHMLAQSLDTLGQAMLDIARDEAPIAGPGDGPPGFVPGALRRGITLTAKTEGARGHIEVVSTADHTKYVVGGRGSVFPIRAKVLAFWKNNKLIFRKSVGPAKANEFMDRAAIRIEPVINTHVSRLVGQYAVMMLQSDEK
jgi:hypothetical protein